MHDMALTPDNDLSIARYRQRAARYDDTAQFTMPLRQRTINLLQLKPGDVVLDVGCGTGLSYAPLMQAVGAQGRVLAFEQSPDMFEQAERRVDGQRRQGNWNNLWHTQCPAETVVLPQAVDAVLFNYVHDITRTPVAVANILRQAKPGARIAMAGMKFFPWWTGPLNLLAWLKNRPYNAKPADLWHPWDLVQAHCTDWQLVATQAGMGYIASGRLVETASRNSSTQDASTS